MIKILSSNVAKAMLLLVISCQRAIDVTKMAYETFLQIHSNLDLGAVNLSVYLDLVANSLLTEILLIKSS